MIPETITYDEAAERYRCDRKAIRKAILAGEIDAYKPGKNVLIDRKQADAWFMSTKQVVRKKMGRPRSGTRGSRR